MTNQTDHQLVSLDDQTTALNTEKNVDLSMTEKTSTEFTSAKSFSGLRHYCQTELRDFWRFIKNPTRRLGSSYSAGGRWCRLGFFLLISYFFYLVYTFTIGWAIDSLTSIEYAIDFSKHKYAIFFVILLAPVGEELLFRLGLRNATYTLFFGPVLISILGGDFFVTLLLTAAIVILAAVFKIRAHYWQRERKSGFRFHLGRQFIQAYPKIFWFYAVAFSLGHIGNYSFDDASGLFVIFAVLPQLLLGFFLGYLRLRDGIVSSICLHFLNNLLAFSLIFIFPGS